MIKDPSEISLRDVMAVIEGQANGIASNTDQETATSRVLLEAWQRVANVQHDMLNATTFADLVERVGLQSESMYYI